MSEALAKVEARGLPLLPVETARAILAQCVKVDDALEIKSQAQAMARYLREKRAAAESVLDAQEIGVRAERRIGQLTKDMGTAQGERTDKLTNSVLASSKKSSLQDVGLSEMDASRAESLASIPDDEFDAAVETARESGRVSREAVRRAHVANNSGNNEWYTPAEYIAAARLVMGGIDLDPATSEVANRCVGAESFYTEADNGLDQPWFGRVWMNPPYAQPLISHFSEKVAAEYEAGRIASAIVLVNNGTETKWGARLLRASQAWCYPTGRIRFIDPDGNPGGAPLQGQMVVYFGPDRGLFKEVFGGFGPVGFSAG